jgi:hypothetical protein
VCCAQTLHLHVFQPDQVACSPSDQQGPNQGLACCDTLTKWGLQEGLRSSQSLYALLQYTQLKSN